MSPGSRRGKRVALAALLLAGLLDPRSARADQDGEPEGFVARTSYGGLAGLSEAGVRLASMDLRIEVVNDPDRGSYFIARSSHLLANPGPPREVVLAVPMEWWFGDDRGYQRALDHPSRRWLEATASLVKLRVAGKRVPCEARPERVVRESPHAYPGRSLLGTCRATVRLPQGDATPVDLETTGFLRQVGGDVLQLGYWLSPIARWPGRADSLRITVDLGALAPFAKIEAPSGGALGERFARWELRDTSLGPLDAVRIQMPGGWQGLVEGHGWVRAPGHATVSLVGDGPIEALTDGDPSTTWCGSLALGGGTVAFEARLPPVVAPPGARCAVRDLALAVQWLDHERWMEQGPAVTGLQVRSCARPEDVLSFGVAGGPRGRRGVLRDRQQQGLLAEVAFPAGVLESPPDCLRIEVTRTDPRTVGQFCLGELEPRAYCRDEAAPRPSLEAVQRREFARPWRSRPDVRP